MGQIVIDIPNRKSRRYVIADRKRASELLKTLEASAVRLQNDPKNLMPQQIDDIFDYIDGKSALDEMRATGRSYSVTDLRNEFGIK